MRIKNYFLAIVCAISAITIGCTDDELVNGVIKYSGDDIVFGGQAGYEMNNNGAATRTIYTGERWTDPETGKTYEGVNWIAGDMVRIYCPQAGGVKMADYKVNLAEGDTTILQETNPHEVQLAKTTEVSLQWSNTTEPYTFYAVYPAPDQYSGSVSATEILNGSSKIVGEIPSVQVHKGKYHLKKKSYEFTDNKKDTTGTGTHYIVAPDMKYAYMVAKTTVQDPNKSEESVYLQFMPIATAVEITLQNLATADNYENGYTFNLANVFVSSANGEPIYGTFEKDLAELTDSDDDVFADAVGNIAVKSEGGTEINLPMNEDGLKGNPIALKYGDKITFTVFILPTQNLNDLKVTILGVGGRRTAVIKGIEILMQKKNYLTNIPLTGDVLPFTQAEWIKYIEDDVLLSDLSIPGAGGAASGEKNSEGAYTVTSEGQRQQNLNIEGLWNKGIRCFEFATDCDGGGANLGEEYIICNGQKCAIQLKTAVSDVVAQLNAHPDEFAMVILGYQTLGGWDARTPATYMTMLNAYWPNVKGQLTTREDGETLGLYDPTSITGDVRGKLFCIARPTSIYQDYGRNIVTGTTEGFIFKSDSYYTNTDSVSYPLIEDPVDGILVIKGWGNLKDKWQQRGYTTFSRRQTYAIAGEETTTTTDGKPGRPFDPSTLEEKKLESSADFSWDGKYWAGKLPVTTYAADASKLNFNFAYETYSKDAKITMEAWVQEWARVSQNNDIHIISSTTTSIPLLGNYETRKVICWNNTRSEKVTHIQDAMLKALNKTGGYDIYINSLCGYYVSQAQDAYKQSLLPCLLTDYNMSTGEIITSAEQSAGLGGDIATFAADMNQVFYNYLQGITTDANGNSLGIGPMGIVLMDRVGDDTYSNLIPGIIVANNFKQTATVTTPAEGQSVLSEQTTLTVNGAEKVTARSLSDSPAEQEMTITWE